MKKLLVALGWLALFGQVLVDYWAGQCFLDWWGATGLTRFIGWSFWATAAFHCLSGRWRQQTFAAVILSLHLLNALCCLPLLLNPWMWIALFYLAISKSPTLFGLSLLLPGKELEIKAGS